MSITVCIPTIEPRASMLQRAVASITSQTILPDAVVVTLDEHHEGAAVTRDRALAEVETEFVAFLDDDDEFEPNHLQLLLETQARTNADLVYSWFTVIGGTDPFPEHFGQPWDNAHPHQTAITFLARTKIVRNVGGFRFNEGDTNVLDPSGHRVGEDYQLVLRMVKHGAKIVHLPARTWLWYHHGANTSGMPSRW